MCPSHVDVSSITGDGEAVNSGRSSVVITQRVSNINREQRAKRKAEYVPRPTDEQHHLINREQREKTYTVRLNQTWRLIHSVVCLEKGLRLTNAL